MPYRRAELRPRILRFALLGEARGAHDFLCAVNLFGDLEAPHGVDLPLRRAVPHRVRAEDDAVGPHELEQLSHEVRGERRKCDDRGRPRGAELRIGVLDKAQPMSLVLLAWEMPALI